MTAYVRRVAEAKLVALNRPYNPQGRAQEILLRIQRNCEAWIRNIAKGKPFENHRSIRVQTVPEDSLTGYYGDGVTFHIEPVCREIVVSELTKQGFRDIHESWFGNRPCEVGYDGLLCFSFPDVPNTEITTI